MKTQNDYFQEGDFLIENHGSVVLLQPLTIAAEDWLTEHTPEDAQHWGTSIVIEPRYVSDILNGIELDGLKVIS
jgi:hypothetical protein